MPLIPQDAYTLGLFLAVIVVAAGCLWSDNKGTTAISLALIVSLIAARLSTYLDSLPIIVMGLTVSAIVVIFGKTLFSRAILMLYGIRLIVIGIYAVGAISLQLMWESSGVFLILQLLIALGASSDVYGGGIRSLGDSNIHRRGNMDSGGLSLKNDLHMSDKHDNEGG